jgi:hypothetical protein
MAVGQAGLPGCCHTLTDNTPNPASNLAVGKVLVFSRGDTPCFQACGATAGRVELVLAGADCGRGGGGGAAWVPACVEDGLVSAPQLNPGC